MHDAFPVAVALWRKGTAPRNVFIFLGYPLERLLPADVSIQEAQEDLVSRAQRSPS